MDVPRDETAQLNSYSRALAKTMRTKSADTASLYDHLKRIVYELTRTSPSRHAASVDDLDSLSWRLRCSETRPPLDALHDAALVVGTSTGERTKHAELLETPAWSPLDELVDEPLAHADAERDSDEELADEAHRRDKSVGCFFVTLFHKIGCDSLCNCRLCSSVESKSVRGLPFNMFLGHGGGSSKKGQ